MTHGAALHDAVNDGYPKSAQDDLTAAQLKTLKAIIETEYP